MTPERWKKLDALFHEAVELHGDERSAHLARVCAGDQQLRVEVERLLSAYEQEGSFIDSPIYVEDAEQTISECPDSRVGNSIGPYLVISHIGRGGMGEVYLAEDTRLARPL